ncbi:MAG: hypothetical protein ACTHN5_14375 [Phycisphaerae bacterium]
MTEPLNDADDELEALARERAVQAPAAPAPVRAAGVRSTAALPGWTRFAAPLLLITIVALLSIGGWAVGAEIYMHKVDPIAPEDIRYPLLHWSDDVGTSGGYSMDSQLVPLAMLGAFPLAILLLLILVYLRRQQRVMGAHTTTATSGGTPPPP